MEALYHQTSQLIQETSNYFYKLENDPDPQRTEEEIQSKLNTINKYVTTSKQKNRAMLLQCT